MPPKKPKVQYRYYKTPPDSPVLALLGPGWVRPYGNDLAESHFHNLLEIGYCYEGTGSMVYGEDVLPYGPGTISVVPPNFLHNTIAEPGTTSRWEYLFVDTVPFLQGAYAANPQTAKGLLARVYGDSLHLWHREHRAIGDLVLAIADTYRHQQDMYLDCARGLLIALMVHIARQHTSVLESRDAAQHDAPLLHNALEYAGDHYPYHISVADMAACCHISQTHLRRLFARAMGISPLAYVNHVRIEAAQRLLGASAESIRNVATRCGFATPSTFNRNFLQAIGMTPQQWRKSTLHHQRQSDRQSVQFYDGWL
ncbi:MAG: AraC family transcriptional regulator [Oscillospiraceae bacterium]|jgi:AraC-like DNA-binding protein|nr:AraC family transcriptional regulator [Oscillospiraceae bacterium]